MVLGRSPTVLGRSPTVLGRSPTVLGTCSVLFCSVLDYCLIFPRPNIQTNLSFIIFKSILLEQFWSHYMFRRCCPVHVCCITEGCLQIIMSSQQKFNWSLIPIVPRHKSSATSLCLPIRLATNLSCCPHAKPLPPACTTRFPGCHLLPAQTHLSRAVVRNPVATGDRKCYESQCIYPTVISAPPSDTT